MAQKTVTEIPANPLLGDLRKRKRKLRVAAYCRVSTDSEEQINSYTAQKAYYTQKSRSPQIGNWPGSLRMRGSPGPA